MGMGTSANGPGADGFAEQFQGFNVASPIAVSRTHVASFTSIKVARGSGQATGSAEPTDNATGAAMLAALLFGVPGAAPTALPTELHLTGDSLPPVRTTDGTGTPIGQQQPLPGVTDAPVMATQLEVAMTQIQQPADAGGELLQSKAAAKAPVPLPAVSAGAGSEATDLAFAARLKRGPATPANLTARLAPRRLSNRA